MIHLLEYQEVSLEDPESPHQTRLYDSHQSTHVCLHVDEPFQVACCHRLYASTYGR